jgi:hypothetical protein
MSTFLYIIGIIIFGLFFSLNPKKKNRKMDSDTPEGSRSSFPTGQDMLPEAWKTIVTDQKNQKPRPVKKVIPTKKAETPFLDTKEEGISTTSLSDTHHLKEKEEEENYSFQNIDDVRKGIVWSEILKRKY